uniref:Ribosomal protein-like n=1 Tax=Oryza sativa subsp. japonica TaxID=39947 RepID=Q69KD5_ORYSJ|nr:ribosomal protein-like [Oryza sativa Japonica Group]
MSESSEEISSSDNEVDPTEIYTMEDYLQRQQAWNAAAAQLASHLLHTLGPSSSQQPRRRRRYCRRDRIGGHARIMADYFCENPVYSDRDFRRRFRMRRPLFLRILNALGEWSEYFTQRVDGIGQLGLSPIQKCTAVNRMLAYAASADQVDEYCRIGGSTALESLKLFCQGVIEIFGPEYLHQPNVDDTGRLLQIHGSRGFPDLLWGRAPRVNFMVNGHWYDKGYYLADGIYPEWATLVKSIKLPQSPKQRLFANAQESQRKDVECAFGILKARFKIIAVPCQLWKLDEIGMIMRACIIMHNMIIEDERGMDVHDLNDDPGEFEMQAPEYTNSVPRAFAQVVTTDCEYEPPPDVPSPDEPPPDVSKPDPLQWPATDAADVADGDLGGEGDRWLLLARTPSKPTRLATAIELAAPPPILFAIATLPGRGASSTSLFGFKNPLQSSIDKKWRVEKGGGEEEFGEGNAIEEWRGGRRPNGTDRPMAVGGLWKTQGYRRKYIHRDTCVGAPHCGL